MVDYTKRTSASRAQPTYDAGLRAYMLQIYNYMTIGLGITALAAYLASRSPEVIQLLYGTPLHWVLFIGLFLYVMFLSSRIMTMDKQKALIGFFIYSALMGLCFCSVILIYEAASIARVLLITTALFAGMSLYGYTTKKDLTGFGSFLFMGLWGLIIAMVVNWFMNSPAISYAISLIGVFIFTGLIIYDTNKLKKLYYSFAGNSEMTAKASIMGALTLYLDFINLFLMLLRLFGNRR